MNCKNQEINMQSHLDDVFFTALSFHHYANTAYPLTPTSLKKYEVHDIESQLEIVKNNIKVQKQLSLYVHVPFCQHRCRFCEYVVLDNPKSTDQDEYVEHLLKEIDLYKPIIKDIPIVGYDLGGGTPCILSIDNIKRITEKLRTTFNFKCGVSFSIETTPIIAAKDLEKITAVRQLGYDRISMGFQTVNASLLAMLEREGSTHIYDKAVENIRRAGFKRLNIDLMYGFASQSNDDFRSTVRYAISKNPEYITLYRNRYKGTKLEAEAGAVSLHKANVQYAIAYEELKKAGYVANNGKNTFSKVPGDLGTSDYLTTRVVDATSYVGFGLGAQSFVGNYLAYNLGCDTHKLDRYFSAIDSGHLPINDIADMPLDETIAKALSVMFYFGFISQKSYLARFNETLTSRFSDEINYLRENGIMDFCVDDPDKLMLTDYGVSHCAGAIALFYSKRSQEEMHQLCKKKVDSEKYDKTFLKFYDQSKFDRPSIATDIIAFDAETYENVLLIVRAENPFVGKLALPGGFFTKSDESIEACAKRELHEETGCIADSIKLLFLADAQNRDPRGWIVSAVYGTTLSSTKVKPRGDDDALCARWFKISELTEDMLAFDHWQTLQKALKTLKGEQK